MRLALAFVLTLATLWVACSPERQRQASREASAPAAAAAPLDAGAGWWHDTVFYEIFVRSFADSSSGPLAGDGIGDLDGLIERLDYLNDGDPDTSEDLGVNGIWLMPVADSPSYHGYDVADYRAIEEDYGTVAGFRRLIDEAHRRGIRVIVDLVLNHTSSRHPWFLEARSRGSDRRDWYRWSFERQSYLGPWGQPVWHQLPWWRRGWRSFNYHAYYGIFSPYMPDLDYRNPEVTAEMHDVARFWLEELGVDGFRLDAIRHLIEDGSTQVDTPATHEWLAGFHAFSRGVAASAVLVGEVWAESEVTASYGPDELDLTFQFDLAEAFVRSARDGERSRLDAAYADIFELGASRRFAAFLSNHDQPRVLSQLYDHPGRARTAAALLLTGTGVPFLYYGEEIGMQGFKPDPLIRRPMQWSDAPHAGFSTDRPWQKPHPDWRRTNVAVQSADPSSLLAHYRRLIQLRHARPALRRGHQRSVTASDPRVWATLRELEGERLLVIVNLSDEPVADYTLEPSGGPWGASAAGLEWPEGAELIGPPTDAWTPLVPLEANTSYVIELLNDVH